MAAEIHCFLSKNENFPEIINFSKKHQKVKVYQPKDDAEFLSLLPSATEPQLLLFDANFLSATSRKIINFLSEEKNFVLALVTAEDGIDENIKYLNISPQIGHLIPAKNKSLENEMHKLLDIVMAVENNENINTTLSKALNTLVNKRNFTLTNSQERWLCYEEIDKYVESLEVFNDFKNIVKTATSELLTNAFYDAPRNPETGESLNPNRKAKINLVPPKEVEFTFGLTPDNKYLWLFVKDPFGSLDKPTLVAALLRAATEHTALLDHTGGAGLGLKMVYEWASELVFGLTQGESTLVGCKFKLTRRNRIFDAELASLHICIKP